MVEKKEKRYIHIYKGEGKGKTSILNGTITRALGYDFNIKYVRFLKNRPSGEILFFKRINYPKLEIINCYKSSTKFVWDMNEEEKKIFKKESQEGFKKFCEYLQDDSVDLVAADEILGCIENNFIKEEELIKALKNKKEHIEVLLSGRYCSTLLDDAADLISVVNLQKHYFNKKKPVFARKGIEF